MQIQTCNFLVDIGGIVAHHCLHFPFTMNETRFYLFQRLTRTAVEKVGSNFDHKGNSCKDILSCVRRNIVIWRFNFVAINVTVFVHIIQRIQFFLMLCNCSHLDKEYSPSVSVYLFTLVQRGHFLHVTVYLFTLIQSIQFLCVTVCPHSYKEYNSFMPLCIYSYLDIEYNSFMSLCICSHLDKEYSFFM